MRFRPPLVRGTLLRRYQRFFADVRLDDGRQVTAHCPNTGSMLGVAEVGRPVLLTPHDDPRRKLAYTWELIKLGRSWVGVNTARPNALVAEAIEGGRIPELRGYDSMRREVPYGNNSRIDLLLEAPDRPPCYVEVKNVTLANDGIAAFPDSVTVRGQKHLRELSEVVRGGARAVLLFWVFRKDCEKCRPADEIDGEYGRLLRRSVADGVEVLPYDVDVTARGAVARRRLPLVL